MAHLESLKPRRSQNHFWLRTSDLDRIGVPNQDSDQAQQGGGGALTINGLAVDIEQYGKSQAGSGCAGCCRGCALTLFQLHKLFSISSLNLHPGANATISYSAQPVPVPPPPPPPPLASGAIRVGDYKLLVGAQRMASWFGDFSPNATYNGSSTGTTACAARPCLFNIATGERH